MVSALKDVTLNWGYKTNRYDTIREKFIKPGREKLPLPTVKGWGMGNSYVEDTSGCLEAWVGFEIVEKGRQWYTRAGDGNKIVLLRDSQSACQKVEFTRDRWIIKSQKKLHSNIWTWITKQLNTHHLGSWIRNDMMQTKIQRGKSVSVVQCGSGVGERCWRPESWLSHSCGPGMS